MQHQTAVKQSPVMLDNEYKWFLDHRTELTEKHKGQYAVIKDDAVVGVYPTMEAAYLETIKEHRPGTFLIQLCETEENTPRAIFHSRVYV